MNRRKVERAAACAGIVFLGALSGCASQRTASMQGLECSQMLKVTVPASAIALPTKGAVIVSATPVPAVSSAGGHSLPPYCKVLGRIIATDPSTPPVNFEVDLPDAWNRKALMLGGSGFNGAIPETSGNVPAGPIDRPVPLARGYAVFAGDSGHQASTASMSPMGPSVDAGFALNPGALQNYAGDALKKTRDAALFLIRARYGVHEVDGLYFAGESTGGREALHVLLRWPQDWDGAIAWSPAWNQIPIVMQIGKVARALAVPGAWLNPAERKLFFDATLEACDDLDGAKDGIVSHVAACSSRFDLDVAHVGGRPLRCPAGEDHGDACLSDAQLELLKLLNSPIVFEPPLADRERHYPGYNVYGADLGMTSSNPAQFWVMALALGTAPPSSPPIPGTSPSYSVFWDQWARYVFAGVANYDAQSLDPVTRGGLRDRIDKLSESLDVSAADFSAFARKGGKLIIAHGAADVLVSNRASQDYVARVQLAMGEAAARNFLRYYEVPGFGHGVSTVFNPAWDSLTALDDWVESGSAPPPQIVTDSIGVPGRTRPLCEYPSWPQYRGAGDTNAASSFSCVRP